ncbi:PQQ-dependent sugar dehydrogenase [Anatilimnocola sp. NA78]|uniref:PQQ-dependent sugar dehydrogenase n=1 Tax=Anatilimnocola sp. NA78 TaxID=3415683 RepID=UPI003CE45166
MPSLLRCWMLPPAVLVAVLSWPAMSAEPPARKPWTTSQVVGSPDPPPPYKVVRVLPNLKFNRPLLLVRGPEGNRLFVGEQTGKLYSFTDDPAAKAELFIDLKKEISTVKLLPKAKAVEIVYGLVFHPDFAKNRQCFICYTLQGDGRLLEGTRVSRFTVTATDPPRVDPGSEEVVITFPGGGHNGGDLHFGPDGMLYISTGDGAGPTPPDRWNTGQDISDLLSSILRIDVDNKDGGKNYAIPKDNPFLDVPGARGEIWAYGFRNPWRMSFDRQTGDLFVGDVGWELWEMVHRVERGGNYGWSAMEGPQPVKPEKVGPSPIQPALIELPHTMACSITGGLVYRGKRFPELHGSYLFGDWETRRLWAARFEDGRTKEMPELARPSVRFVAFAENHAGEIYFLDEEVGTLHTLEKNDANSQNVGFPTSLSKTGLFASVKDHQPAKGVRPFAVNSPQWQDGATADRWIGLPGTSTATLHATGKPIPGFVSWHNFRMHFPKDTVLTRTLSWAQRRVETQLLHYDGLDWRAYTYAWNEDQTDAQLVPADGAEREVTAGKQKRLWQFQSRSQCLSCHNNQSQYALAFEPAQLNRNGADGKNQLVSLTEGGFVHRADKTGKPQPPFDAASVTAEASLGDPSDDSQSLDARARAYLHANCGHCHSEHGGGTVALRFGFPTPVAEMKAVDARPTRGDFGLPDARIIKPGDPYTSTLFFRMAKQGRDRMPHIGAELCDEAGLNLIAQWIESLQPGSVSPATDITVDASLAEPKSALILARKLGRGELKTAERESLLASAAKLPAGNTRDLFERYFPSDTQGPRKLGSNPRPQAVLALKGNAAKGEKLFWSQAVNCGKCHQVGQRGSPVGPELSTIGKSRSREDLLTSLLTPSRRIEPKFATYLVQTTDGRSLAGVLVKRDENFVVLRDAQGKEVSLATADVEGLRPSHTSLMPEGQLAGLTPQEAADLLEFLSITSSEQRPSP